MPKSLQREDCKTIVSDTRLTVLEWAYRKGQEWSAKKADRDTSFMLARVDWYWNPLIWFCMACRCHRLQFVSPTFCRELPEYWHRIDISLPWSYGYISSCSDRSLQESENDGPVESKASCTLLYRIAPSTIWRLESHLEVSNEVWYCWQASTSLPTPWRPERPTSSPATWTDWPLSCGRNDHVDQERPFISCLSCRVYLLHHCSFHL